ncbi:hypothetical protein [Dactylosporangium aurantiacum]|uniref:hypothetical protein n=1 Tax=Dactylosporangium aurantiacum TaxID=35754 RepID=UPI001FE2106C|nr:hypothetical protein [Dactylosporangium aurantiacum]
MTLTAGGFAAAAPAEPPGVNPAASATVSAMSDQRRRPRVGVDDTSIRGLIFVSAASVTHRHGLIDGDDSLRGQDGCQLSGLFDRNNR